uniref:Uncharacterized protein n=1 Tax=Polysiphonia urceolata TaxID=173545 RepID=A0A1Z1MBU0_POLUR|nr:hypothetical protein [Polysiphonia stricta]ARW63440.1 hypothetical protein [Polysiphonia stricta]
MIKYWPNQQSIHLNNAVVNLFVETEKKLVFKTYNNSNQYLYLDILSTITRTELLEHILSEFKKLVLDLIEINLQLNVLRQMSGKIEKIFINRTYKRFLFRFPYNELKLHRNINVYPDKNSSVEYLLIYFIFGSSYIDKTTFLFEPSYTPYNQVKVLLENFIIEIGNNITSEIINNLKNSTNINNFLRKGNICNKLYASNRSIILFVNNLKWQNFMKKYIYDIKSFYNERQQVWIISSGGILTKYIYISRTTKIKNLNQIKVIFILWLEIKDLIIPKTEKLIIQIFKYLLYCSINLFSNLILILIKIIVFYLKT